MKWRENTPENFVRYVRNDLMGRSSEDLVYDISRHVDSAVHMFEEWGLLFSKTEDGRDPNRVAGAVRFSVRDPKFYVFKARPVVCAASGAINVWRPHAVVGDGVFRAAKPSVLALIITG